MLGNHTQVLVPSLEVANRGRLQALERERCDVIGELVLREDLRRELRGVMLVFNSTDYHRLQDQIGLARVGVTLGQLSIR